MRWLEPLTMPRGTTKGQHCWCSGWGLKRVQVGRGVLHKRRGEQGCAVSSHPESSCHALGDHHGLALLALWGCGARRARVCVWRALTRGLGLGTRACTAAQPAGRAYTPSAVPRTAAPPAAGRRCQECYGPPHSQSPGPTTCAGCRRALREAAPQPQPQPARRAGPQGARPHPRGCLCT